MGYLMIIVVAALFGITRLWLLQRRERAHLDSVEGFRSSLEKLSEQSSIYYRPLRRTRASRPATERGGRRPVPLDAERRDAARRRLEQRRRRRARGGWLVSS